MAKPNGFEDICEKKKNNSMNLCNSGRVFRRIKNPHFNSMQDIQRNIRTKSDSSWASGVREEEFWKIANDDDDGRQVMAIAHMAFGQVN